jgi:uncharacterized protein YacL
MAVQQLVHRMVFGLATTFGGLAGAVLASASSRHFAGLSPIATVATYMAFVIFGLTAGILCGTPLAAATSSFIEDIIRGLQKLAVAEVVMGGCGLIVGLFSAFFVSLAIQTFEFGSVPFIGVLLGPALILLSALLFACLGAFFGYRLSALPSIRRFFEQRSAADRQPVLVDTSIIVDGRLGSLLETGFLDVELIVPSFILGELQLLADSEDALRRVRGRRGLEGLDELRRQFPFKVMDEPATEKGADQKLIQMARRLHAAILTNDYNLQKVASVQGLKVLNLNQLAAALKPSVLPGQLLHLLLQREGKESHQAVAHLEDGTMVVVERGRAHIGREALAEVTSVMQTATGKMVFAKFRHLAEAATPNEETA